MSDIFEILRPPSDPAELKKWVAARRATRGLLREDGTPRPALQDYQNPNHPAFYIDIEATMTRFVSGCENIVSSVPENKAIIKDTKETYVEQSLKYQNSLSDSLSLCKTHGLSESQCSLQKTLDMVQETMEKMIKVLDESTRLQDDLEATYRVAAIVIAEKIEERRAHSRQILPASFFATEGNA